MNLHRLLLERQAAGKPVTVGIVGAGKFGTMYLSQARLTAGVHVVAVADLNVERAKSQLTMASWPAEQFQARDYDDALKTGKTLLTLDAETMIKHPGDRGDNRGDGRSAHWYPSRADVHPEWQAYRDGECGSRCGGRAAAGASGQGGRGGLLARLG